LLRAYQGDKVQIRTLVGAHTNPHSLAIHGANWLFEPFSPNSGYKSSQAMGLSEHFEMLFSLPASASNPTPAGNFADYVYAPSSGVTGLANGTWGLMRAFQGKVGGLQTLPNNPQASAAASGAGACPATGAPQRTYNITAIQQTLTYNSRNAGVTDANALVYSITQEIPANPVSIPSIVSEPASLRAAAGECVTIILTNGLTATATPFTQSVNSPGAWSTNKNTALGQIPLQISSRAGLHPQLMSYDVTLANGVNAGFNPDQTVGPTGNKTIQWYAGNRQINADGTATYIPVELGAINLTPADELLQVSSGLVGGLIVEPKGSSWTYDPNTRASATVTGPNGSFREFVVVAQDNAGGTAQNGQIGKIGYAVNYKNETPGQRGLSSSSPAPNGISQMFSNSLFSPPQTPQTPVFTVTAGTPFRMRVLYASGNGTTQNVFYLHGHQWQEEPHLHGSAEIGFNPLSQVFGAQLILPYEHIDLVAPSAGGSFAVPGDYLYGFMMADVNNGLWGLLHVTQP
jgi:hypothetical protein